MDVFSVGVRLVLREKMAEPPRKRQKPLSNFWEPDDVLGQYNDPELLYKFRLDRAGIKFVVDLLRDVLQSPNALTPELHVLLTLRYLATGSMLYCYSEELAPSRPVTSRDISHTLDALSSHFIVRRFIKLPTSPCEVQRKKDEFLTSASLPDVVGAIGTTLNRISTPDKDNDQKYAYVDKDNNYSIKTQFVFDANCNILNAVTQWPGSSEDTWILHQSELWQMFEENHMPAGCLLIGDSNYACLRWFLTPYLQPQPGSQTAYNRAHKKAWSVVERGLNQLKYRFPVLDEEVNDGCKAIKACNVVLACAVLHNICKERNIATPPEDPPCDVREEGDDMYFHPSQDGLRYRDNIAAIHFNQTD